MYSIHTHAIVYNTFTDTSNELTQHTHIHAYECTLIRTPKVEENYSTIILLLMSLLVILLLLTNKYYDDDYSV